jgi:hypothetical protein
VIKVKRNKFRAPFFPLARGDGREWLANHPIGRNRVLFDVLSRTGEVLSVARRRVEKRGALCFL